MLSQDILYFVEPMIQMASSRFPKSCKTCGHIYKTFREFISKTAPLGAPMADDKDTLDPLGMISFVNCDCGSTLVIKCEDPNSENHKMLEKALANEAIAQGCTREQVLLQLRDVIRKKVTAGVGPTIHPN